MITKQIERVLASAVMTHRQTASADGFTPEALGLDPALKVKPEIRTKSPSIYFGPGDSKYRNVLSALRKKLGHPSSDSEFGAA